jgi:hypothetical protein
VFFGNQSKPVVHCYYRTEKEREISVTRTFESRRDRCNLIAKRAEARKAFINPYKVGDIFRTRWGYDQTNIEYFEVIAATRKTVTVRELQQVSTPEQGFMTAKCSPMPGLFIEKAEPIKCVVNGSGIRIDNVRYASFLEPRMVAGVPTYAASSYSWTG